VKNKMEKKGLEEIDQELLRQLETKKDYIVDTSNLITHYDSLSGKITMEIFGLEKPVSFELTDHCHNQVGAKLKIPSKYYDYLKEKYPELLIKNVNTLLPDQKTGRMVRTLDGQARAFLSDRYKVVDNYDIFRVVLQEFEKIRADMDLQVIDSRLTDQNLYIKAISKDLTDEISREDKKKGDVIYGGIIISNSEVGQGKYKVMPYINVVVCNNGMIRDKGLQKVHLGRKLEEQMIDWSDKTNELEDELLISKIRDMVHSTFKREVFQEWVDEINKVAREHIPKPTIAVNKLVKTFDISKEETDQLLHKFAEYGYTKWGLCQTVTDIAQTQKNYDKQVLYERIGPKILEMEVKELQ
jgi:hypothetical protein